MFKRAYQVQMSYDVSDAEKLHAEQALQAFDYLLGSIENFTTHLDLMWMPFKENQDITPEQIWEFRATFGDYRDQAKENIKKMQNTAFKCINIMENFISDTQVEKIMKSFNACMEDVLSQFNDFLMLFKALQSKDFKENAVKSIDAIKKETAQLKEIVEERVQNCLEKDILARNWTDFDTESKIEQKTPFDIQLFQQREESLKSK